VLHPALFSLISVWFVKRQLSANRARGAGGWRLLERFGARSADQRGIDDLPVNRRSPKGVAI
jgi:hypothetical protein